MSKSNTNDLKIDRVVIHYPEKFRVLRNISIKPCLINGEFSFNPFKVLDQIARQFEPTLKWISIDLFTKQGKKVLVNLNNK